MKHLTLTAILALLAFSSHAEKYVGGDISMLPEYENANATYYNHDGEAVTSPLTLFKEEGLNAMRVRLFVNPSDYTQSDKDDDAKQDLDYVKTLGQRIKEAGFSFLLDIHYSDTWADPSKQWTPTAWEDLSDDALAQQVYDYTADVLTQLEAAGAAPDLIQTGNEISYGMLWGAYNSDINSSSLKVCWPSSSTSNWDRFATLLQKATAACRDKAPQAKIILHVERVSSSTSLQSDNANYAALTLFFDRMTSYNIDYDVIGLSYYPHSHGAMSNLEGAINALSTYNKDIMVVETGYPYAWAMNDTKYNYSSTYAYSDEGQALFTTDLVAMLNKYSNVTGLFWWWMEYNAYGTSLTGWYNGPLFDSRTGCATSALSALAAFNDDTSVGSVTADDATASDQRYYNLSGQQVSEPLNRGTYIRGGKKYVVR